MGFLFRLVFLYVPLLAIVAVGAALFYGVEDRPAVTAHPAAETMADLARARLSGGGAGGHDLSSLANTPEARALLGRLKQHGAPSQAERARIAGGGGVPAAALPAAVGPITLDEHEVDALLAASIAKTGAVRAQSEIHPYGGIVRATLTLPAALGPLGRYVNLRAAIPPSPDGLIVSRLAVGRIEIPAALVKPALGLALDLAGERREALDDIRSVTFSGDRVTVDYRPDR